MPSVTCPPPADLDRLFLGGLPAADAEALEQHVLECDSCLAKLKQSFSAKETLADVLRDETGGAASGTTPIIADLIRTLESLRPLAGHLPKGASMLTFACTACQKNLGVKDELAGKQVKCPTCGAVMTVLAPVPAGMQDLGTLPPEASSQAPAGDPPTHPPSSKPDVTIDVQPSQPGHDSSLVDFLAPAQAGDELGRLGKYRILKILGHGGMGVVYKAEDLKLKRTVAIKAMLPALAASASAGKRFLREAEAMAAVEHDHIVRIYQIDEDRHVPFLAMEFLKGEPLDERLKRQEQLPLGDVLRIGREIAEGLAAAHATGLIHRDIKPANIWLEAPRNRVKILDFGLARALSADSGLTQQGAIVGTPAFMAPEQGRGEPVDARTDLFSLGVVLYQLCTGQQPFHGADSVSTLMAVAMNEPPAPVQLNSDLPQALSDLVMKLLEKDPANRVGAATEAIVALERLERECIRKQAAAAATQVVSFVPSVGDAASVAKSGRAVAERVPSQPRPRRRRLVAALFLLCGLLVVSGGVYGVIRIATPEGDYVIDTDDPDFSFKVSKGTVILEDAKTKRKYKLKVVQEKGKGAFELEVTDPDNDLVFNTKTFTIKRGQQVALKAWFERKQPDVAQGGRVNDAAPVQPRLLASLKHGGQVSALAFTADGLLISGGSGANWEDLKVFDPIKGVLLHVLPERGQVRSLAIARDSKTLFYAGHLKEGDGYAVRAMDLASRKVVQSFPTRLSEVGCMALSADDRTLAYHEGDHGLVQLIDLQTGKNGPSANVCKFFPRAMKFSPDGSRLVVVNQSAQLLILDAKTMQEVVRKDIGYCDWLDVTKDGLIAVSSGRLFSLRGDLVQKQNPEAVWSHAGVSSPDGQRLAIGGNDGVVYLWRMRDQQELLARWPAFGPRAGKDGPFPLNSLAFSRDGKILATAGCDGIIKVWDLTLSAFPPLDPAWLTRVAAMKADQQVQAVAEELKKRNPHYDGTVGPTIDKAGIVIGLTVSADDVTDLSPVQALPRLLRLHCFGSRNLVDLGPLKHMKLTDVRIDDTMVSDLSPLKDMQLFALNCTNSKVFDLSPLKEMKLSLLWCSGTKVTDLSPLKGMPLRDLRCDEKVAHGNAEILRSISTLNTINGKDAMQILKAASTSALPPLDPVWLTRVAAMKGEEQVKEVKAELMKRNPNFDGKLTPLIDKAGVVTGLRFSTENVTDIAPVRALTQLRALLCDGSGPGEGKLTDLTPLVGMHLTELYCNGNPIADLAALKDMKLIRFWCAHSLVADLAPLKDMPLSLLNCDYTAVSDLTPLRGMKLTRLNCTSTKVSDLSPVKGMPLEDISCEFQAERDGPILRAITTLKTINGKDAKEFLK